MSAFDEKVTELAERAMTGAGIARDEAVFLMAEAAFDELLFCADRIRRKFFGNEVSLCSIVNARSGACTEDCAFCSQSVHCNTQVESYPLLDTKRLVDSAVEAEKNGVGAFSIVTSGEELSEGEFKAVLGNVEAIRETCSLEVHLSVGRLTEERARALAAAGAACLHHNLETSSRFFPNICTTHTFGDRVETAASIRRAGVELCCGGLFGMGETWEDRVDLALALRELKAESVPLNFLHPIPGTPLGDHPGPRPQTCLRTIALFRFILPQTEIRVCGGRVHNLRDMQSWIFKAGASGMMTGNYLTTLGRTPAEDLQMLRDLGLTPRKRALGE